MSDQTVVTSNASRVAADIGAYIADTHKSEQFGVKLAARGVVNGLLKLTPPLKTLAPSESFSVQKKVGIFAVERDLLRSFKPITDLKVLTASKNPVVFKKAKAAVDKQDATLMAALLTNLKYPNITADRVVSQATPALHDSLRHRGRVPKGSRSFFVFSKSSYTHVEELLLAAIGRAKAGWMAAGYALDITAPDWILRHGAPGAARDRTLAMTDPSFTGTNNVSYLYDYGVESRIVELALSREAGNMERELIARRAGLWNKKRKE